MAPDEPQIEVVVEYDEFIAGRELSDIINVLDEVLWLEINRYDQMAGRSPRAFIAYRYFSRFNEPPPLFCISEVGKGSMLLTGAIGGAAATYCFNRFKKGFRRSHLGDEIEVFGKMVGNELAKIVERMNLWLEDYVAEANEEKSRIKSVRVRQKKSKERESR
jgi:hypothetical protein